MSPTPPNESSTAPASGNDRDHALCQNLLRGLYDGVAICHEDGRIRDTNERLQRFLGLDDATLRTRNITEFISGASHELVALIHRGLAEKRHVLVQAYIRRADTTIFPVEISANYLGGRDTVICFFRDITVRKKAEDLLRTGYNAISNCLSGIAVADPMGIIVYVNPAAVKLWGCTSERDLQGQSILNLWKDRSRAQHMLDMIMDSEREWNGDLVAQGFDGRTTSLHVAAARNVDYDDDVSGMVFSFIDISDRLRADTAVREAETREAMLASLAAACHHLGQPATVLLTSIGLLKLQQPPDGNPEHTMLLDTALEAANKLAEVLEKLAKTSEYRTTDYLNATEDRSAIKILEIE